MAKSAEISVLVAVSICCLSWCLGPNGVVVPELFQQHWRGNSQVRWDFPLELTVSELLQCTFSCSHLLWMFPFAGERSETCIR